MNKQHKRKPVVLIKSGEIKKHFTMSEAIEAMTEAFGILSSGGSFVPQRNVMVLPGGYLSMLLKPVVVDTLKRAALKVLTQKRRGAIHGIPAIVGIVLLIDTLTGEILSIMDGESITALRTGAASGLAAKCLARENAKKLAVFGCGTQGKTQLEAVITVRNISKVWVFDKNRKAADSFVSEMKPKIKTKIKVAENLEILKNCDIICTATNAETPLFHYRHLKKGVHINAVGSYRPEMQEIDPEIMQKASVYVDSMESCIAESGDLIKPINDGIIKASHIKGEIGELILGKINRQGSNDEITVFKSVGVAIQDFVMANKIFEKSISNSFGQEFNFYI